MTIPQMRNHVEQAYDKEGLPNRKWRDRVAKMGDMQIYAVYMKMLENGTFDKKKKVDRDYQQLTVFDI